MRNLAWEHRTMWLKYTVSPDSIPFNITKQYRPRSPVHIMLDQVGIGGGGELQSRQSDHTSSPQRGPGQDVPSRLVDRRTDTSENITFPCTAYVVDN